MSLMKEKLRKHAAKLVIAALVLVFVGWLSWPQQEGDPTFDARVAHPTCTDRHPRVLFDEAHWNVHKTDERYKPFSDLMRNDGYVIVPNKKEFTAETLKGYDVLVIANALGFRGAMQHLANLIRLEGKVHVGGSAFSDAECDAVRDWVKQGGSLLLISDHSPTGEAAGKLSERFGVVMTNWYTEDDDPKYHDPELEAYAFLFFSRENGLLLDHPITRGRNDAERIHKVLAFTGQSLRPPEGSVPLLKLSPNAREYPRARSGTSEGRSAARLAQGVALEFSKGRVVVLGEAAMLTSQVARSGGRVFHFGMSRASMDNRQLALNVMHWLSHKLN
jgi:hypothetical protein